jgi:hypothetical protein
MRIVSMRTKYCPAQISVTDKIMSHGGIVRAVMIAHNAGRVPCAAPGVAAGARWRVISDAKKAPPKRGLKVRYAKAGAEDIPPSILLDQTQCVVVPVADTACRMAAAMPRAAPKLQPQADALLCFLVKVYPASKSCHWPWWTALRAAGVPIVASWIDAPFNHDGSEPSSTEWAEHWERCCREAAEADIALMYACAEERQNGALIEVGAALGAGKQVYLVSPHDWSWKHHPRVRVFDTLEAAIVAIMAGTAGERARQGRPRDRLSYN